MTIRVNVPWYFQRFTKGADIANVDGNTVGECLKSLIEQFPLLEKELFDDSGELTDYVGVCINREIISSWEKPLGKSIGEGDVLTVMFIGVGGG